MDIPSCISCAEESSAQRASCGVKRTQAIPKRGSSPRSRKELKRNFRGRISQTYSKLPLGHVGSASCDGDKGTPVGHGATQRISDIRFAGWVPYVGVGSAASVKK